MRRAFGEGITVSKVVDLDVFDIISVGYIHITVDVARCLGSRRGRFCGGACSLPVGISGKRVETVDKKRSALEVTGLTERIGGTSTCWIPFLA